MLSHQLKYIFHLEVINRYQASKSITYYSLFQRLTYFPCQGIPWNSFSYFMVFSKRSNFFNHYICTPQINQRVSIATVKT